MTLTPKVYITITLHILRHRFSHCKSIHKLQTIRVSILTGLVSFASRNECAVSSDRHVSPNRLTIRWNHMYRYQRSLNVDKCFIVWIKPTQILHRPESAAYPIPRHSTVTIMWFWFLFSTFKQYFCGRPVVALNDRKVYWNVVIRRSFALSYRVVCVYVICGRFVEKSICMYFNQNQIANIDYVSILHSDDTK